MFPLTSLLSTPTLRKAVAAAGEVCPVERGLLQAPLGFPEEPTGTRFTVSKRLSLACQMVLA